MQLLPATTISGKDSGADAAIGLPSALQSSAGCATSLLPPVPGQPAQTWCSVQVPACLARLAVGSLHACARHRKYTTFTPRLPAHALHLTCLLSTRRLPAVPCISNICGAFTSCLHALCIVLNSLAVGTAWSSTTPTFTFSFSPPAAACTPADLCIFFVGTSMIQGHMADGPEQRYTMWSAATEVSSQSCACDGWCKPVKPYKLCLTCGPATDVIFAAEWPLVLCVQNEEFDRRDLRLEPNQEELIKVINVALRFLLAQQNKLLLQQAPARALLHILQLHLQLQDSAAS